ncbi:transposase [Streptomyces lunaelactis]|uniref:transposase n=1 Tax=Streptomyces lunaelactis TaxID=1535768 RepID=UPI0015858024|nr:transposase [Streptomyces lunaelactis]NUK11415.1 transposase [Streptomyces lunaelactis]NUK36424.1 transposase [Streptomyces lunaelactis]NUK44681.1 transposase [Streptomyces lunaelactis]NUK56068.1 transposase [Streptomyces lunaelactis]NUK92682.1 transposase [Streptomyces lunaelactis]
MPDLEAYLADLLRNRERLAAALEADDWAKAEAMPSDEEISRVRRLIKRVKDGLDELDANQRAEIDEAITVARRGRQGVMLGMPRVRQPLPDLSAARPACRSRRLGRGGIRLSDRASGQGRPVLPLSPS